MFHAFVHVCWWRSKLLKRMPSFAGSQWRVARVSPRSNATWTVSKYPGWPDYRPWWPKLWGFSSAWLEVWTVWSTGWLIHWLADWNWLTDTLIGRLKLVGWKIDWPTETGWPIHWMADWNWLTDTLIGRLTPWWNRWLIDWLTCTAIDGLIDWLIDGLIDWLMEWMVDWVVVSLSDWLMFDWLVAGVNVDWVFIGVCLRRCVCTHALIG